MSKVEAIEAQLQKLSTAEMCAVRDWLDQFLKTQRYEIPTESAAALREDVQAGAEQVRAGKTSPFDDAAVARIKAQGKKLLNAKR
jgi:hypothetical protein